MELKVNWHNWINSKKRHLKNSLEFPNMYGVNTPPEKRKEKYEQQLEFLDTKAKDHISKMIEEAKKRGYTVENHPRGEKYTAQGNLVIRGERNGMKLYGFINPMGRLSLDYLKKGKWDSEFIDCLTINYRFKNCVVHDKYLAVLINQKK